jgi:uncharacterized protein YcnI
LIRRLLAAAAAALLLPPTAFAHVTVMPSIVEPGVQKLTLTVPNEFKVPGGRSVIKEIEIEASPRVAIRRLQPHGHWVGRKVGGAGVWSGGSIGFGDEQSFVLSIDVPDDRDELSFVLATHFGFPPQRTERFPLVVRIASAGSSGGTSVGVIVGIAVAAGAVLLAIAFVLARWLRGAGRGMRP